MAGPLGFTIWFTGLPCSGKSTLAELVAEHLRRSGRFVEVLDGDEVRTHLSADLGFSKEDRDKHILRVGWLCKILSRNGVVAIAAFISPYREIRDLNRRESDRFVEVFTDCPVEVCARRDVKGMYERAMRGEIKNFTGVSDPYENPLNAEVVVHTDRETPEESAAKVLAAIEGLGYMPAGDGQRPGVAATWASAATDGQPQP
jgi:adenylylsulfate kinase